MAAQYDDSDDEFQDARETQDDQATPKALPSAPSLPVPSFSLDEDKAEHHEESKAAPKTMPPPSIPVLNGKSTNGMNPPQIKASPGLMAPPTVKASNRPSPQVPQMGGALRVPATGPVPNRNPAASQRTPNGLPVPQANTAGKRNKVLLKPGHSPLDWATLTRKGNLSGVPSMQRVTPSMLKYNNGRKGRPAWSSYKGKVYNISPYLPFHPGGEGELMRGAGRDGEKSFMETHPWVNWDNMLSSCLVGIMVSESAEEGLDGLD